MKVSGIFLLILFESFFATNCQQSQCIKETNPTKADDCTKYSDVESTGSACCFYEALGKENVKKEEEKAENSEVQEELEVSEDQKNTINSDKVSKCISVPYSAYTKSEYDYINGTLYRVNCGTFFTEKQYVLSSCGEDVKKPSLKKCKKYSTYVDSCCYYGGTKEDGAETYPGAEVGCYWLGAKYDGKLRWGGMKLKCSSTYQKLYLFSFLIIFLVYF